MKKDEIIMRLQTLLYRMEPEKQYTVKVKNKTEMWTAATVKCWINLIEDGTAGNTENARWMPAANMLYRQVKT